MSDTWPRAVLFDLDGTLIDSAPDLHASINILLMRRGLGPLSLPDVVSMIGNGVKKLVERAFIAVGHPLDADELDLEYEAMIGIYADHLTVLTVLTPGAREIVEELHAQGVLMGVVTNKPQMPTEAILDHFGLSPYLDAVIGGDSGVEKKPAPDMIFAALDRLGLRPEDAVLVGDSVADVGSARAAGIPVIALRGGYTSVPVDEIGADIVIDGLADLLATLAGMRPA
ncbi:phosphoglycolate phosphatase [Mesorhizobium australicum]|uniref:Phosphoglycolate phosphatase n=1 Tax=Mesorhizobium australicum TaxID=536018 RepID=A0A1X7N4L8_9HYPH|nr:phosphoglycolate phosphatase [Mesorhizobium australicum]SMH32337.1 phosphoglycolate phosphatase [Mesorhizobium australicum]